MSTAIEVGCQSCDYTGFVRVQRDGAWGVLSCQCRKDRIVEKGRFNPSAGPWPVPEILRGEDMKSFSLEKSDRTVRAARLAAARYSENPQGGILLAGLTGTGKSHLAVAILKTVNRSAHFCNVPELMKRLRATFNSGGETDSQIVDELVKVPVLALDDIGAERVTGYAEEMLYLVIDQRWSARKKLTVFTTNKLVREIAGKPSDMMQDYLTERCYSRVKGLCDNEAGHLNFYQLEGADRRYGK